MRFFKHFVLLLLGMGLIYGLFSLQSEWKASERVDTPSSPEPLRALWLSQYDMHEIYTDGSAQRESASYRVLIRRLLDNVVSCGFNAVIVQVRPFGDSLYPSALYPPSYIATARYGADFSYDPFALLLEEAHAKGLAVHAWINPLRLMREEEIVQIPSTYLIRAWYDDPAAWGSRIVSVEGRLYLNPAYPEVRELIASGATEIVARYEVDGVHMDDYFYPTEEASFDREAYAAAVVREPGLKLGDFRRRELNLLVSEIYARLKSVREDVLFGISPGGNLDNTYHAQYADVYTWCREEGYIDYICPQLYFGLAHETWDFASAAERWQAILEREDIGFFLGMTFGKIGYADAWAGTGRNEWLEGENILADCTRIAMNMARCNGVAYFSYRHLFDPISGEPIARTACEAEAVFSLFTKVDFRE